VGPELFKWPLLGFVGLLAFAFSAPARSDVVCNDGDATVSRTISRGDFQKLVQCVNIYVKKGKPERSDPKESGKGILFLVDHLGGRVLFDSEGGDVNEAMEIGQFLREALPEIGVFGNCFSACFLAVVGAVEIDGANDPRGGKIGIHRPFAAPNRLKQINSVEYAQYYNNVKGSVWQYLLDMDVPVALIEKMFSVPSTDLYFITHSDIALLSHHPAYEEWLAAQCPKNLSPAEEQDYRSYKTAILTDRPLPMSEGYARYLLEQRWKNIDCTYDVRWRQPARAVGSHLNSKSR
jgi:hypothetical protein